MQDNEHEDERDPIDAPVSPRASKRAMFVAQKVLEEVADDAEWEKIMGLIVGNLSGHAYTMIRRHRGPATAERWRGYVRTVRDDHVGRDSASRAYACRVCDNPFDTPAQIGNELGQCSPCCHNHFVDKQSQNEGRPCARACCPEVDPEEAAEWEYEGD